MRLPEIIDALEARDWNASNETGGHDAFVKAIVRQLWSINGQLINMKHDLVAAESACEMWKQSFSEQVKYNIQMQAENMVRDIK
jgi:hypothetical protein